MDKTETHDPSKLFIGTKLYRDADSNGIILDHNGDWKSGRIVIELFNKKNGFLVSKVEKDVTKAKYVAWKEDFDVLTIEEVLDQYFKGVETITSTETDLQREQRLSDSETSLNEKDAEIAKLKALLEQRDTVDEEGFVGEVKDEPKKKK